METNLNFKELFYFAKNKFKRKILHSCNLSGLGKLYALNVN